MRDNTIWSTILTLAILGFVVPAHAQSNLLPADIFDLSEWNITVPVDKNKDKKPDTVSVKKLKKYVGQIHAVKYDNTKSGFGYGNEPIKIYYKKFPNHNYGSVFWTYERNLAKDDENRTDLAYPVFGTTWASSEEPELAGIKLGEKFSYSINVHRNTMYLAFSNERHGTKTFTSLYRNW